MRIVEIHELQDHITEILQSLQEKGETVAVTKQGKIIAHLVPTGLPQSSLPQWLTQMPVSPVQLDSSPTRIEIDARRAKNAGALDDLQNAWDNFDRLAAEPGVQWTEGVSAVDAVRDVRREL